MATFWEIAAGSVNNLLLCILSICNIHLFSVSVFGSGICLLIAPVPVHCFSITFEVFSLMVFENEIYLTKKRNATDRTNQLS